MASSAIRNREAVVAARRAGPWTAMSGHGGWVRCNARYAAFWTGAPGLTRPCSPAMAGVGRCGLAGPIPRTAGSLRRQSRAARGGRCERTPAQPGRRVVRGVHRPRPEQAQPQPRRHYRHTPAVLRPGQLSMPTAAMPAVLMAPVYRRKGLGVPKTTGAGSPCWIFMHNCAGRIRTVMPLRGSSARVTAG
jgi:hypothetical protein